MSFFYCSTGPGQPTISSNSQTSGDSSCKCLLDTMYVCMPFVHIELIKSSRQCSCEQKIYFLNILYSLAELGAKTVLLNCYCFPR